MAAILGPGLIPIAAIGVPAVAGLAAQMGSVALAGGTAILAFQGVGDALDTLNKASLDPTTENLEAARVALEQLSPAAQSFVRELHEMAPAFEALRDAAASGLFPGLERSLGEIQTTFPVLERILFRVGDAFGDLAADAGAALGGPEWREFFKFISREAPTALTAFGRAVGDVAHGLAELTMAFAPLNHDFTDVMLRAAASFDAWASGLSQTQGFQEFVDYLRENGPRVADALGAMGNALLQIVEAAAPLGGPVLEALTALANVVGAIADSNAGPAIMATVAALSLLSRGQSAWGRVASTSWATAIKGADTYTAKLTAARTPLLRSGAALAGLALASSGVADGFGLSNTASLALVGTLAGPWGAAVGGAVGLMLDLGGSQKRATVDTAGLTATLDQQTGAITQNTRAYVAQQLEQAGVLESARALGLSLSDVTSAALDDEAAMARVTAGLEAAQTGFYDTDGRVLVGAGTLREYADNAHAVGDAIGDTSGALTDGQSRLARIGEAAHSAAGGFEDAKSATQTFTEAIAELNNTLERRASLRNYEAALDTFTEGLKENGRTLDINTEKGRANQENLDNIAGTAIRVSENLRGMDKVDFLTRARRDFVDARDKLLGSKDAAQQLASELGLLTRKEWVARVIAETGPAATKIAAFKAQLASIDRDIPVNIHVSRTGGDLPYLSGGKPSASGGTVPKSGLPYADRYLYMLADGEEVISNRHGQADRHRQLLKAINAGRMAGGGTAGGGSVRWGGDRDFSTAIHGVIDGLVALRRHLKESEKALAAETARRDDLRAKAAEVSSGISSGLRGDSIWEGSSDVWAAGATRYDPIAKLNARKDRARRMIAAINTLRGKGITGAALAEILGEGLEAAEFMASQADDMLGAYTTAYAESEAAVAEAAQLGGQETYGVAADALGPGIRELNQTVKRLQKQLDRLSGEHKGEGRKNAKDNADFVAAAINGAAKNGKRKAHR